MNVNGWLEKPATMTIPPGHARETEMNETQIRTLVVRSPLGLHLRPASQLARLAGLFECDILITYRSGNASAKSAMGLLLLGAEDGAVVQVATSGTDAALAMDKIAEFFRAGLGENGEVQGRDTTPPAEPLAH